MAIVPWLSSIIIVGPSGSACISVSSLLSHIAPWAAVLTAMYSASDVNRATMDCFLLSQLIGP